MSFIFIVLFMIVSINVESKEALIKVPVADMLCTPLGNGIISTVDLYHALPCMGEDGFRGCARVHQCLFNEVVTLLRSYGDEVQVAVKNTFYGHNSTTNEPLTALWTLESNIVECEQLRDQHIDLNVIPKPIDYRNSTTIFDNNVLTLILPWHDNITNISYSVGTRFTRIPRLDTSTSYAVQLIDFNRYKIVTSFVPRPYGLVSIPIEKEQALPLFLQILRTWLYYADQRNGIIPYVWGGSSFVDVYQNNGAYKKQCLYDGQQVSGWFRIDKHRPYAGFDCSGLILRACQIAGIPYFYKNSTLAAQHLPYLCSYEDIMNGDILWIPGHVMIVSNKDNDELIEAAGYHKDYGEVHMLPLSKVFANITTYQQLKEFFLDEKTINILHKNGTIISTDKKIMILKLASLWKD